MADHRDTSHVSKSRICPFLLVEFSQEALKYPQNILCLFCCHLSFRILCSYSASFIVSFLQNKWLRSLNQAVDQVLGGGGQGSSPGMTAMSRKASYTFSGEGRFKDAQYTGGWLAGRVHGRLASISSPSLQLQCVLNNVGSVFIVFLQPTINSWILECP